MNFVISCLRLAGNPEDSIHRAIYNRFLGRGFGERLIRDDTEFLLRLRLMPPEEAFENTVMRYGLGCSDEDISYLQALHEQIIAFTKSNVADIPLFLSWWTEKGSTKSIPMPSGGNAITIDTIHRSKGLGYKAVIDDERRGLAVRAYIAVTPIDYSKESEIPDKLQDIDGIMSCDSVAGSPSYMLTVRAASPSKLEDLLNVIHQTVPVSTETTIVLQRYFSK